MSVLCVDQSGDFVGGVDQQRGGDDRREPLLLEAGQPRRVGGAAARIGQLLLPRIMSRTSCWVGVTPWRRSVIWSDPKA
jgi:hypothetical protein